MRFNLNHLKLNKSATAIRSICRDIETQYKKSMDEIVRAVPSMECFSKLAYVLYDFHVRTLRELQLTTQTDPPTESQHTVRLKWFYLLSCPLLNLRERNPRKQKSESKTCSTRITHDEICTRRFERAQIR